MQNQSVRWCIVARAFNLAFWSNSGDFAGFEEESLTRNPSRLSGKLGPAITSAGASYPINRFSQFGGALQRGRLI